MLPLAKGGCADALKARAATTVAFAPPLPEDRPEAEAERTHSRAHVAASDRILIILCLKLTERLGAAGFAGAPPESQGDTPLYFTASPLGKKTRAPRTHVADRLSYTDANRRTDAQGRR